MLQKIMYVRSILLFLSACAIPHNKHDTNPAFSEHQYNGHDVNIVWKSEKTDTGIRIAGAVTNSRYELPYEGFELTASLLDENKKILAKNIFRTGAGHLTGSVPEPFKMGIPLENKDMLRKIKFFYSYGNLDDHFTGTFESVP